MTRKASLVDLVGFVGLGNMGKALASNLVAAGQHLVVFDIAGTPERAPEGANCATSLEEIADAGVVVLSLPDGDASRRVTRELAEVAGRRTSFIVDTSTIGITAAQEIHAYLDEKGVTYVDAPVSGGVAGAQNRTIAIMFAGQDDSYSCLGTVLDGMTDRSYHIGHEPGMGQAMKLANNFLSATALASTSEAISFGVAAGLELARMLEVLNASSGQSSATSDKFPNHVVTERYASGFTNALMVKDLGLYRAAVAELGTPFGIGAATHDVWDRFVIQYPSVDFTRIYPFIAKMDDVRE